MNVPFTEVVVREAALRSAMAKAVEEILDTGAFILGPGVERFETAFAAYVGKKYCLAVNSGTSALHLALLALGIGPGDEVVTVPNTFIATLEAISYTGATIRLADVDETTYTMNPASLRDVVTGKTRAIIPVHLYGHPADLAVITAFAAERGIAVIEDACQAHGALVQGKRVGGFGTFGCFSFYPSKNLGACGEGGALVTDDERLVQRVRMYRDHGQREKGRHAVVGYNYRMPGIQGAILAEKLPYLDGWNRQRREAAVLYGAFLKETAVIMPRETREGGHVFHLYVVRTPGRDDLRTRLAQAGIATGIHYPIACHLTEAYHCLGYRRGSLPVAEKLCEEIISLPMFPGITEAQIAYVCNRIRKN